MLSWVEHEKCFITSGPDSDSSHTCTKYHLGSCSPFIHSVISDDSVNGQWRPRSDCADAQADQNLHCQYIPKDTFSHIYIYNSDQTYRLIWVFAVCLTHCILNRLSHTIYWKSRISILGKSSFEIYIFLEKMAKLFANSGDPDQTPHSAESDLGLHCLPFTLLRVSRLQWVNQSFLSWCFVSDIMELVVCQFDTALT